MTDWDEALLQQVRYFSSDDVLVERAAPWRGATPEECLAATIESCEEVELLFSMMHPDVRERASQPEPVPDNILAVLEAMQR